MPNPKRTSLVDERGVALIMALLAMVLLTGLGTALTLVTMTESRVSASYRDGAEAFYAADAAIERVVHEIAAVGDWNGILDGSMRSPFVDGPPGTRRLPNGATLNLTDTTALVRCGNATCTDADLDAATEERPWGANNPRWQLYAHGRLADMSEATINSPVYVVAWVADDPSENDGKPLLDGDEEAGPNPGREVLRLLVHAYGLSDTRRVVEATLARTDGRAWLRAWREIR
jgi:hypothetical protein